MCAICQVTEPGAWITTIADCARQEKLTIPEAVERVVSFVDGQLVGEIAERDRQDISAAIRRDGGVMLETTASAIEKLRALLPVVPDNAEGAAK